MAKSHVCERISDPSASRCGVGGIMDSLTGPPRNERPHVIISNLPIIVTGL